MKIGSVVSLLATSRRRNASGVIMELTGTGSRVDHPGFGDDLRSRSTVAMGSDFATSAIKKPISAIVHHRAGTIRWDLVRIVAADHGTRGLWQAPS